MKTKRIGAGQYEISGTTTLDGVVVNVRYSIWRHEEIRGCWLSETVIDGRSTGTYNDYCFKDSAVAAAKRSAAIGYKTVPGLGVCCC